ncbi:predicted protein [Naegleria gruberi]|uniref:Predicted protein n=1 Tax=Naegleria gruberi TaxID=5762 RepID=D2VBA2_NAEGR|nr:uncharacterized protein NAEGRDRAFT_66144 [Naegleria gruberi]EFC45874.1 predicted protein [Naegleria gruberi]|eukprot:XP_002678618.1 predicted protein [Naegleria gruberi strain NEG-M]
MPKKRASASSSSQVLEEGSADDFSGSSSKASASSSVSTTDDRINADANNNEEEENNGESNNTSKRSKTRKKRKVQTDYCEEVKLNTSITIDSNSLDYTEDKPPLNDFFDYRNYLEKTIIALDIGSSFVKGAKFKVINSKSKPSVTSVQMKFDTHQFYPSRIFCKTSGSTKFLVAEKAPENDGWKELENIKKLFLVQEALAIKVNNEKVTVSNAIYHFIKELLTKSITKKSQVNGKVVSELSNVSAFILTCPTGTTENIKKVYRNCLMKALASFEVDLDFEHLYVIEEFVLLKYYCDSQIDIVKEPTLYIDVGHLTLDISVVEFTEDGIPEITFKNGEVGGMSIVHKVIQSKYGEETLDILASQFESNSSSLIEELVPLEKEIEEALHQMMVPLCLIIVQKNIKTVHFAGAVTRCKYFETRFREILKKESIQDILDERRCYFKDQYKDIDAFDFNLNWTVDGLSALITGVEMIINSSIYATGEVPLTIGKNLDSNFDYHVGILDEWQKEYAINLDIAAYDMYAIQDFEIFILKFNAMFDLKKCSRIDQHNYNLMGISEFERFTTVELCIDGESILTTNPTFIVTSSVDLKAVHVNIYFKKRSLFAKSILKILRNGRLERIAVNDAVKTIFLTKESDEFTWYGSKYITKFYLTGCKANRIDESTVLIEFGDDTAMLDKLYSHKKSTLLTSLPEITEGDNEKVRKDMGSSCVACGLPIPDMATKYEVTPPVFHEYSFHLDEISKCGYICTGCHQTFKERKKGLRKSKKKKSKNKSKTKNKE